MAGKSVGLFGRARCGTSTALKRAIAHARRAHGDDRVGVMGWTTAAARMIDGHTMHKFLRVGVAERRKDRVLDFMNKNRFLRRKVANTDVIFIDELSLIPTRWLTTLEYVVRQLGPIGKHGRPWGRCQVVDKSCYNALIHSGWRQMTELVMCFAHLLDVRTIGIDCHMQSFRHCTDTRIDVTDNAFVLLSSVQLPVTPCSLGLFKVS